jgi:replicative DNA helicase
VDVERAIVSKIASTGDVESVLADGIRVDHFISEDCRQLFRYIVEHKRLHRLPPSLEAIKSDNPNFEFFFSQDALSYLIEKMKVLVKRRLADELLDQLAQACDDPDMAKDIDLHFLDVSRQLATIVPTTRIASFKEIEPRIAEYERKKAEGKPPGIPYGFPTLDEWTGGIKPWQMVSISAFTGAGKSTIGNRIATNLFLQGKSPLIISLEMDADEIFEKIDSMILGIDSRSMMHLRLRDQHISSWRDHAINMRERVGDIKVIDSLRYCTVDNVYAEMVRHLPDVCIVDYIQLMRSPRRPGHQGDRWAELQDTARELKAVARTLKIPIVVLAQTNRSGAREGATLDNIGGTISIAQDSDVAIGLFQDEDMREADEMQIRVLKNRGGRLGQFAALWDHEQSNYRELTPKDMFRRPGAPPPTSPPILSEFLDAPASTLVNPLRVVA